MAAVPFQDPSSERLHLKTHKIRLDFIPHPEIWLSMSQGYKLTWYSDNELLVWLSQAPLVSYFLFPASLHHRALAEKPKPLACTGEKGKERGRKTSLWCVVWFLTVDFGIHLSGCLLLIDCHWPPTPGRIQEMADRGEDRKSRGRREPKIKERKKKKRNFSGEIWKERKKKAFC